MFSRFLNEGNFCTIKAVFSATGTETVYDTTNAVAFCIGGKAYVETGATTDGTTPTTDAVTGDALVLTGTTTSGEGAIAVWCLDSSLAHNVVFSKVSNIDKHGNWDRYPEFPAIPNTLTPFAYQVLKYNGTSGTFTFGSDNWDATGLTLTNVNVMVLPRRPTIS